MATKLILGLKEFNKDNKQLWTVPRKGTASHSNLLKMMGREDLAKRQDENRYNQLIKRQEELSRLEHNLGMVVKVNKIRKFLGSVKEKVAEKKKAKGKKTEISKMSFGEEEEEEKVPSVAEQVLFNPDLLRKIGGYKKDLEYKDKIEEIIKGDYFPDHSDDGNDISSDTWIGKLLEDLESKKNPAVSEKIGSFYIYGGEGSQGGMLYDMVKSIDDKLDFPFTITLTTKKISSDSDIEKYFDYYLQYKLDNLDEDEDEDEVYQDIRDEAPEELQMTINYKDNKGRLDAIEFLKVLRSVIRKKLNESD